MNEATARIAEPRFEGDEPQSRKPPSAGFETLSLSNDGHYELDARVLVATNHATRFTAPSF